MRFASISANGVVARAVCGIVSIVLAWVLRHSGKLQEMLLDSRTVSRPYLERKGVEAIVRGHLKGNRNYTTEIHRLLSLELLRRLFVDAR